MFIYFNFISSYGIVPIKFKQQKMILPVVINHHHSKAIGAYVLWSTVTKIR